MKIDLKTALAHVDENLHQVTDKGDHVVITYHFMTTETFRNKSGEICPIRTEFRGICFDKETGKCIRRPYHKFFNLGELKHNPIDFDQDFYVMDKLDGSLVAPYKVGDRLIWGTKSGETEMTEEIAFVVNGLPYHRELMNFVEGCLESGITPLFEYVSPHNRIVLPYDQTDIVLLGARFIETGNYILPYEFDVDIPIVASYSYDDLDMLEKLVREEKDMEGVVVMQGNNFVKIKSLWYVQLHKNKELIETERNVVEIILDENIDDVLPLLQDDQKENLMKFNDEFWVEIDLMSMNLSLELSHMYSLFLTRKDTGLAFNSDSNSFTAMEKTAFFRFFEDADFTSKVRGFIVENIRKNLSTNIRYEKFKMENFPALSNWSL